jgi:hypothetical protein
MQREMKWKNWPVLAIGVGLIAVFLVCAKLLEHQHLAATYFADLAGATTTVVMSIAIFDEWERRRERKRYMPPEKMGIKRIREEINQLLYQYAFVLNLRYDKDSNAMKTARKASPGKAYTKSNIKLHAKAAKHISQDDPAIKEHLFELAQDALQEPKIDQLVYKEVNELILQTERAIRQIDLAVATYGYSFTPEVHHWALGVREQLSQSITGELPVLSIRLAAASKNADDKLNNHDRKGIEELIDRLIKVGKKAKDITVKD